MRNEGGLDENLDKTDPGGVTYSGVSLSFLKTVPSIRLQKYGVLLPLSNASIKALTPDQIKLIIRCEFWEAAPFEKIQNQILCNYIFDMCVNHGIGTGIELTQRAICACQKNRNIKDDGVLGAVTVQAINYCSFMLQVALMAQRAGYYYQLVALNPVRISDLNGWLNRCYRT